MFSQLRASLRKFTDRYIGSFTWNTPPWIKYLHKRIVNHPLASLGIVLSMAVVIAALFLGYRWYQSLPQPVRVTAQITPPKITPVDKVLVPDVLQIQFGTLSNGQFNPRSVAPINLIDKEVTQGISIHPAIAGKWTWTGDNQLTFSPATDWPAGETYTINFTQNFFSPNTKMEKLSYTFSTLPFTATINEFKFYQDPATPTLKQAVATVSFNYPVDANSLENKITLMYQALKNGQQNLSAEKLKYAVTYDEHKRNAYIHSEALQLPEMERYLELNLAKGIKAIAGPGTTEEPVTATILIPDASSYFKINHIATTIVRNEKDRPEQVLTIETTIGVTQAELTKSLHAYLLPQNYPATANSAEKLNYQWQDPGEVTADILALAKPINLETIPADRDYATLHSYKFNAATPSYIYIKLDKGISGFGNYKLGRDYAAIQKSPEYPQEISFLHKGAILALGTEEKLSVLVRGVPAVKFDFARVLPNDVNHLITQTSGDFNNPYFIDANFNQNNITEIFSDIQKFDVSEPGKAQYTALDFNQYLTKAQNANGLGLFLLQAHGWDAEKNTQLDVQSSRLILITDLGLIVKDNNDGTHDLFVQSIAHGTPVKNASVSILGKNGLALLTHPTDADGHVNFPNLNDFINEKEPTVYIVHNGNDVSFIPYNRSDRQLNYSRFDIGGTTTSEENIAALSAFIFTDRGIYRPGDTAHIGMIVKRPYAQPEMAGLPLQVTITDPRGVTVKEEKIELNESGYLTLDFPTNATSATGQYFINLYIVKDNHASNLIGSASINVAEFLPDRMRITAQLSNPAKIGWISPNDLTAKVGLWNLYGAPAADRRISAKILLTPQAVTFKEFPDYTFVDPLLDPKTPPKVFTDTLTSDARTNKQGEVQLDLKLDRFDKATYQLTFFAEGFEAEGGRSVTTQTSALVSPLTYLVGYKSDGDLNYIKQNTTRSVNFIAVNPQLTQQALSDLSIVIYDQHPVTTLIKKADGTYQYQSVIQNSEVSKSPFTIPVNGVNYTLPAQKIGNFLIAVTDAKGTELSRFKYSVIGSEQQPLPKNAELTLKLNKSEFAPGEEIEMQITAPYTGAGLITIERDKVYAYKWFNTTTTASVQKIRLPADFKGGGYVNVAFVRDLNSPEIFMSPLSYSVAPFSVMHKDREINIDLSAPTLARPGDALPITYKTDKPAKIIVFAVDEGILQVTKYVTPDPLKFFFEKRALQVTTQQIVDQILPKYIAEREISAAGGDNGEAALYKNLNPFKRKIEAPVVYWSGILDSDTTSKQLIYQVPDYFNGTLRIMAVAAATDAVGSAATTAEVRGHFVINPNVPTFAAPNDEFDVTASVANNVEKSGPNANVSVELNVSPQLEIIGDSKQNLLIPEGEERSVHFKLRAKSILGSAELKLVAMMGDKKSQSSATLSIRPPSAYATTVTSGFSKDAEKKIPLNRVLYPEFRQVEAAVSQSPLILATGLKRYLDEYPYGCTEQLVSKVLPLLALNQSWVPDYKKEVTDKVQQTIQKLTQRQMSGGGFNYWPETGSTESNDFDSVYAMHFLTEAKAQGFNVPMDVFSAGISFLKDIATQNISDLATARLHAYAIYVLTRNEIVTTNYLTNLQLTLDQHPNYDWHNDITSVYIAATYQMLKSESDAAKIIKYFKPKLDNNLSNADSDFYNQDIANAQYVYLLARHFPAQLPQLDDRIIMSLVDALNSETLSTVLAGYSSLALAAYSQFYSTPADAMQTISAITQDGKENLLASATGLLFQKVVLDEKARQVVFRNPARQHYFYQLVQAGFDKDLPSTPINSGIEVYREYQNMDNKVIETTQLGDEIIVRVHARSIDQKYYDNVALVDLLPGGFEVVRNSVTTKNLDYADVREDRVIFFTSLGPDVKEITYKIKSTNTGKFSVPPMFGNSMYNPRIQSVSLAGHMEVTSR